MREEPGKMDRAEEIFDDALEQLISGEQIEDILARYSDVAVELRPMLLTAQRLHTNAHPQMPSSGMAAIMARAQAQAAEDREKKAAIVIGAVDQKPDIITERGLRQPAGESVVAPQTFVERMRRWLGMESPAYRTAVSVTLALLLVFSVLALLASLNNGDRVVPQPPSEIAFDIKGVIQSIDKDRWVVDNTDIYLNSDTVVEGSPRPGAMAQIEGMIAEDERRIADRIVVEGETPIATTGTPTAVQPARTPTQDWATVEIAATFIPTGTTVTNPEIVQTIEAPTMTPPPTNRPFNTAGPTDTRRPVATPTAVLVTSTSTPRSIPTLSATPVYQPTAKAIATSTSTPTLMPTVTVTSTNTSTPTVISTSTPTVISTPSEQPTREPTYTPTAEPTEIEQDPEPTAEPTESEPEPTSTETPPTQPLPTNTSIPTSEPTFTAEPTQAPTNTSVPGATSTPNPTETEQEPEPTRTRQPSQTPQPSHTPEPTHTPDGGGGPGPSPSNTPHENGGGPGQG